MLAGTADYTCEHMSTDTVRMLSTVVIGICRMDLHVPESDVTMCLLEL